jgi:hypothetical protein
VGPVVKGPATTPLGALRVGEDQSLGAETCGEARGVGTGGG